MRKIKSKTKYFKVTNLLNLNAKDVYTHIQKLYIHISKQKRKIKKLQLKIKKLEFLSKLDAHIVKTQQEELKDEKSHQNQKIDKTTPKQEEIVADFINEIKSQAMMNTYEQAGFIYEPTSGLYWDSKTGYYYNPQTDLYYDGNKGTWHRLNPITNEFVFHSETEVAKAVKKVQPNSSIDSLITDFKSLEIKNLQTHALGNEIEEEEAIRKILEDGRQPLKCQEKLSISDEKKEKKNSESRRRNYSSSDDSDSSDYSSRRNRSRTRSRSRSRRRGRKNRRSRSGSRKTREDGELDSSSSDSDQKMESDFRENVQRKRKKKKKGNEYEEIAKKYPPSLRLIVSDSKVSSIPIGSLFVVTFKGGTLGREGDHHDVLLTAENVSKEHLRFTYNNKKKVYQFVDKSRNGTLLNGTEISLLRKEECEPQNLHHGDTLEIAHIKLLAHIHEGLQTCDECEPYNYAQKPQEQPVRPVEEFVPSLSHKEQLKLLQKRYGLESEKYQEKQPGTVNKNYEDRASKRRVKVGSSHDHEKTVQASVDKSISSENKGFKLLSKMGWNEGSSLGKSDSGIKEPVQLKVQQGTSGLGRDNLSTIASFEGTSNKKKQEIWSKTQERYNKLKGDEKD